jgi:hypothetical protein
MLTEHVRFFTWFGGTPVYRLVFLWAIILVIIPAIVSADNHQFG